MCVKNGQSYRFDIDDLKEPEIKVGEGCRNGFCFMIAET